MTQQPLFAIEIIDPAEVEPEDCRLARMDAYDRWTAAFLHRYYARKAPEILASGDGTRIRLLVAWQARAGLERAA